MYRQIKPDNGISHRPIVTFTLSGYVKRALPGKDALVPAARFVALTWRYTAVRLKF